MNFISFIKNNNKPLIFILISVFYCFQVDAQPVPKIKWYTIQEAEALSKQNPRKIMIDVYTDWCGWCKKMDAETFSHPVIAEYINKNYYAVKLNAESTADITFKGNTYKFIEQNGKGYHELAAGLLNGRLSYPSIAYLNEKLELLGAVPGYKGPADMEPLLNYIAEDKFLTQSLNEYQQTFKSKIQ
jgi:thioredoxin-related protein